MSDQTIVNPPPSNRWRWLLPLILALLIALVVLGVYFATHRGSNKAKPTSTPTPRPTATATLLPTATPVRPTSTPKPGPTGTPRPGPTATPRPGPTGTPRPGPTATPQPAATRIAVAVPTGTVTAGGVRTGTFTYSQAQLHTAQVGADQGNPAYTYYLNPFKVVRKQLPAIFGFNAGPITIVSPPAPPQPTPTPYNNAQGLPEVKITVQYQGKSYLIVLDQPETQGSQGIWVITKITAL